MTNKKTYPAIVAEVIDEYRVVINRGSVHDISEGQRFLVYRLSQDELIDPESGESLGYLEIVIGTGRVQHVQEKISTIKSDKTKPGDRRSIKRDDMLSRWVGQETELLQEPNKRLPFDSPKIGDKAKPI